jgi:RHS repeat-associated protein
LLAPFSDDSTLSYLNARYYDNSRGQFLSEDPTSLAVGDPNRLQQFTQDQPKLLSDPQLLNSYDYGRDNPLTNKDPQGLWALRFGIAGTILVWGLTGEMGVQADLQGAEVYYGAGLAGGLGGISFGPQVTTADLSHQYSISTAAFAQGGAVASTGAQAVIDCMNYLLAIVFTVGGVAILVWNRSLSEKLGAFYARRYSANFGKRPTSSFG